MVQGDNSAGKTVLSKKIAWDWAKGDFSRFDIVFYISLKLVRPEEIFEQAIIDQYKLDDITVSKLHRMLYGIGDKYLVILDGLDEHAHGWDSEFMQMITSQEYQDLNILLTTQSESDISQSFETVAKVDFRTYEALDNVFSEASVPKEIISNSNKIVQPNLLVGRENTVNPMLLMFLCNLFDKNIIDCPQKRYHLVTSMPKY